MAAKKGVDIHNPFLYFRRPLLGETRRSKASGTKAKIIVDFPTATHYSVPLAAIVAGGASGEETGAIDL